MKLTFFTLFVLSLSVFLMNSQIQTISTIDIIISEDPQLSTIEKDMLKENIFTKFNDLIKIN
jgi:hypothetical protein